MRSADHSYHTSLTSNVLQTAIYLGIQSMEGQSCDTYYVSEMYGVPHALTSLPPLTLA